MFNKVIVMGNLTKDPELRYTPSGTAVANLRLAINRKYTDKNTQEKKEEVCFITAVAWNQTAENCNKYVSKGSKILVEGRLQSRSWDKEGVKQYTIEILAENVQFLDSKKESKPEQTTEQEWLSEVITADE